MNGVTTRPRMASRILALAGACSVAILSLTGCIKVDSDLTISSDATGSGSLSLELQKQAASLMMISDLDSFESTITSGDLGGQGLGSFADCESSETADAYLYTCTFTDAAFTDADGPWTIAKDGNEIIFTMVGSATDTGDTTAGSDAADLLGGASLGEINANVTFPGPITGMQGAEATKTSDTTAVIKATMTDDLEVRITSEASSGGAIAALLVVLVAVLVLILLVVVVIALVMRRRRPAPEPLPAAVAEPAVADEAPGADEPTLVAGPVVVEATEDAAGEAGDETPKPE